MLHEKVLIMPIVLPEAANSGMSLELLKPLHQLETLKCINSLSLVKAGDNSTLSLWYNIFLHFNVFQESLK